MITGFSTLSGSSIEEVKYVLWSADGTNVSTSSSSGQLLNDGSTSVYGLGSSAPTGRLFTLNSNCSSNQQFELEVTLYGGATAYAQLYDLTSTAVAVSGSQISTTATSATVLRSGKFTITPGHVYGVAIWTSNTSFLVNIVDASLILFP